MKRISMILAIMAALFGFMSTGFAAAPGVKGDKLESIEMFLLSDLGSGVETLQANAAFYLGELKSQKAVIPLMKLLHSGATEETRILAALSLTKIGDPRGLYAVQQNIKFDDSPRVRRMCAIFDNAQRAEGLK